MKLLYQGYCIYMEDHGRLEQVGAKFQLVVSKGLKNDPDLGTIQMQEKSWRKWNLSGKAATKKIIFPILPTKLSVVTVVRHKSPYNPSKIVCKIPLKSL